jgi:hypothetical protein
MEGYVYSSLGMLFVKIYQKETKSNNILFIFTSIGKNWMNYCFDVANTMNM